MPKETLISILPNIPDSPGVYKMLGSGGVILYIGKAKNLPKRLAYYISSDLPLRLSRMVNLIQNVEYITTKSEAEALLLESRLIKIHQPRFNILLRDDKSFPYIVLRDDHEYPQILKYRGKIPPKGKYFGPFASSKQIDVTLEELQKIFKLRSCSDNYFATRKRPCLQYQIKRCTAPCTGKIGSAEYMELVRQVESFLSGNTIKLQEELSKQMEELSNNLEYEKAAVIRDRIMALKYAQLKFGADDVSKANTDVIVIKSSRHAYIVLVAIYRNFQFYGYKTYFPKHAEDATSEEVLEAFIEQFYPTGNKPDAIITNIEGSKTKSAVLEKFEAIAEQALSEHIKTSLQKIENFEGIKIMFNLTKIPERIEVYDNSHIMGKHAVGAMIVATIDGFQRKEYRAYNIDVLNDFGGDDYAMLTYVMRRRLSKIVSGDYTAPDLMIIDGGRGHLAVMQKLMAEYKLQIPFVCMSKGPDRHAGNEYFHMPGKEPFTLNNREAVMKYLQILRDEAHNFAIKTHRGKRSKAIYSSRLDEIEGLGAKRKKDLLHAFGSVASIESASVEEIAKVPGIGRAVAQKVYDSLR